MNRCGNWQKYQSNNPLQRFLIHHFLDAVVSLIQPLDVSTILDAGCAEGFVSHRLLKDHPHAKVIGVDVDQNALSRGRKLHPEITFKPGDVTSLPFKDRSFDLVICNEVLEHLPHADKALYELQRVARHYCLFSVPNEPFFRLSNLLRGKNISRLGDDVDHWQHWNTFAFRKLVDCYVQPLASSYPFPWQIILAKVD
jgi:2-polyprenyl-3-methyl-5-hydroxy-6-metoxy-1,4-benzoquinol methylase